MGRVFAIRGFVAWSGESKFLMARTDLDPLECNGIEYISFFFEGQMLEVWSEIGDEVQHSPEIRRKKVEFGRRRLRNAIFGAFAVGRMDCQMNLFAWFCSGQRNGIAVGTSRE
jgi:hypothetical protein